MPKPNYAGTALKGLLRIIKGATPENQPSAAVLDAYTRLVELEAAPAMEELAALRREVEALKARMVVLPKDSDVKQNRQRRLLMQNHGQRTG